jgi:glycosyltransferase involved in cell wall biosynthesis
LPRVLYLNPALWEPGWPYPSIPKHKGYGIAYFVERGYEAVLPQPQQHRLLDSVTKRHRGRGTLPRLGDLAQQRAALAARKRVDLVYCPMGQRHVLLLRYLRALGLFDVPIVCLVHHPIDPSALRSWRAPFVRLALRGSDALPSFSRTVSESINARQGSSIPSATLDLGPDADFYPRVNELGHGVVAAGKVHRDWLTLATAAARTDSPATIICPHEAADPRLAAFGDAVHVLSPKPGSLFSLDWVLGQCAHARALAIPLHPVRQMCGHWALLDALGMGKPVIATRHPLMALDIEAQGVGIWVAPGDVDGWAGAIRFLSDHPEEAALMGQRARRLVDGGFDARTFAHQLMDVFDSVLGIDTRAGTLSRKGGDEHDCTD